MYLFISQKCDHAPHDQEKLIRKIISFKTHFNSPFIYQCKNLVISFPVEQHYFVYTLATGYHDTGSKFFWSNPGLLRWGKSACRCRVVFSRSYSFTNFCLKKCYEKKRKVKARVTVG